MSRLPNGQEVKATELGLPPETELETDIMKFKTKSILAAVILAGVTNVFAGSTAQLKVIGTLLPSACDVDFAGGGIVDYGYIFATDLSATNTTQLQPRTIGYTIVCNAPITIATSWTDQRTNSVSAVTRWRFGLGLQGTNKIGYYSISNVNGQVTVDGAGVEHIWADGLGQPWNSQPGNMTNTVDGQVVSYTLPGNRAPVAGINYVGNLQIEANIAPTNTLDMTTPVVLDGLATMEVFYL
jgi:hypothetical protein